MKVLRRTIVMIVTISLCLLFIVGCTETSNTLSSSTEYLALNPVIEESEPSEQVNSVSELLKEEDIQSDLPSEDDSEDIEIENEYVPFEPEDSLEGEKTANAGELENLDGNREEEIIEEEEIEPFEEVVTYTIDSVNKTVYTTANVNVRLGPSDEFNVIGSFQEGMEVAVTGVCEETGWYQTSFSGTEAYFDSFYTADAVTTAQPRNETTTETTTTTTLSNTQENQSNEQSTDTYVSGGFPLWNYNWHSGVYLGRLRIPSVGVDVAIYNNNSQATIDAWDSAMFCYEYDREDGVYSADNTIYCGDHNLQGFSKIANCCIGCYMYIDGVDGHTYRYVCDSIDYNGVNTGWGLNDSTGRSANRDGGVWCYTCHDDSDYYIYMVHFSPV